MRFLILICAAGSLAGAGEARSDSPNCDTIKTSLIPYQIKLTKDLSVWRETHTIQMTRHPSGSNAVSAHVTTSFTSFRLKGVTLNGFLTLADRQSYKGSVTSAIERTTTKYERLDPQRMDGRLNQTFTIKQRIEPSFGDPREEMSDVSYSYLRTDNITIGHCTFIAHVGENKATDRKTGRTDDFFTWHFPELKFRVSNKTQNVVFQDIGTAFEPIALVNAK